VVLASLLQAVVTGIHSRLTPALTLFMTLGMTGLFLTGDVFSFYVFFELAMIAAYALTAASAGPRGTSAAFIFAVVNLIGSFLFLIAIGALYRATGTLEMLAIAERPRRSPQHGDPHRDHAVRRVRRQARAVPVPLLAAGRLHERLAADRRDVRRRPGEHRRLRPAALRSGDPPREVEFGPSR
jgi:hypothetical protein